MKLFIVYMHNNMPPILTFGETRAKVGRTIKKFMGPDMVDEVIPISNQDAEAEYGYNYKQQAQWNMIRSESMENTTSVLTGENPFLKEKMDMKKADMGDVIDDFYTSDAPQFQGKSKAKRRQMAIAAKLSADEQVKEEFNIDIATLSEGINAKVLKTLQDMIKGGEEDNVKLLLQGMPKHTKTMYMKRLGIKEEIKPISKNYKESLSILNRAVKEAKDPWDDVHNDKGHYKMTYTKQKGEELHVHHTAVDFKGERPNNPNRVKKLVQDSPQHKDMSSKGYNVSHYGSHDNHEFHHSKPSVSKGTITKEDVSLEDEIEETPKKKFIQDPKLKNLKIPNPRIKKSKSVDMYKGMSLDDDVNEDAFTKKAVDSGKVKTGASKERIAAMQKQDDNRPTLRKETKEAPAGTYFTRSGQLKKGDPASDGPGGAKLASDPLDKQRKTIVNLKNYPK